MVINSTNNNKNEQSSHILTHWTQKMTTTYNVVNPGPGLWQAPKLYSGLSDEKSKHVAIDGWGKAILECYYKIYCYVIIKKSVVDI